KGGRGGGALPHRPREGEGDPGKVRRRDGEAMVAGDGSGVGVVTGAKRRAARGLRGGPAARDLTGPDRSAVPNPQSSGPPLDQRLPRYHRQFIAPRVLRVLV